MKKLLIILLLSGAVSTAKAQFIVGTVVKKVIKAIDLKIQRLQNETIWLQNAQKQIENELSRIRLGQIAGWSQDQETLYSGYYHELWQIKSYISGYQRIKNLARKQAALVSRYQQAWALFRGDKHFSADELNHMQAVYSGILETSLKNLEEIMALASAGRSQMSDAERLELINQAGDHLDENYNDLKQFNAQNQLLSLRRATDLNELQTLKKYYGLH
ncbi:conjugal transfer protein TraI [Mucilaginibacter segetis]|uniref:Conjugal transfer protein TraI n=1 Tax=Mucilaginibacter segetis TaxID=2793071 RepID=A0A934UM52_9SPHI|nr:conjugal transfer protein TraI [Mucilaginibacter segetis]MBK0379283.1 conjugal transfer protein TraI [Mucilaginibacter segetis]